MDLLDKKPSMGELQRALRKEWTALEEEERAIWDRVIARHRMDAEWEKNNVSVSAADAEKAYTIDGHTAGQDLARIRQIKDIQDALCKQMEPAEVWF